jgi:hypothetical protein
MVKKQKADPRNLIDYIFKSGAIDVNVLLKKYDKAKSNRKTWETRWQIIQDQVFPDYRDYVNSSNTYTGSERTGAPRTNKISNHSSAVFGEINTIVSTIITQSCDPSIKWLNLEFSDPCFKADGSPINLSQYDPAKRWLDSVKEIIYGVFADPASNFYSSFHSYLHDWFNIGTSCREIILRKDTGKIQFNTISMQDIYIENSGYGDINTIYRKFNLNPSQAFDLWGENLHDSEKQWLFRSNGIDSRTKTSEYVEISQSNPLAGKIPSLPILTCVVDVTNKHIVDVGLHKQHPYVVSRFFTAPGEIYGRSFVWNAMPDIKIINRLNKRAVQSADYAVFPPILVKDLTSVIQNQLAPNCIVQGLDMNNRPTMQPMQMGGNFPFLMEYYQSKLQDLKKALVVSDIFFPAESTNMTATEVNERKIQANNVLRPLLIRLEHEDLNKTVIRTFSLLGELMLLPPFPYEEEGLPSFELLPDVLSQVKIKFSGPMARMQRLQDIQNYEMLFQKTMQAAQVDNEVLDLLKLDKMISKMCEIYDAIDIQASQEEVIKIRNARREQAEAQAKMQQESQAVDNILKLKGTGIDIPTQ